MSLLFLVLLSQCAVVILVSIVLKVVLNNMLIDYAVRNIEVWKLSEAKGIDRILILTHKPLKKKYVDRVQRAAKKSFAEHVFVDFQIQKSLWGGAVIHVGDQMIDCSLKDRLKQALNMS